MKNMKTKLISLLRKYRELLLYLIFGVATTVVSLASYKLFLLLLGERLYLVSNALAWVLAVLFAFVVNKQWVFCSRVWDAKTLGAELPKFVGARILSLGIEELGLYLLIDVCGMGSYVFDFAIVRFSGAMFAKLLLSVIVVLLNYGFSKCFIFLGNQKKRA